MEQCINTLAFGLRWSHTDCFTSSPLAETGSRKIPRFFYNYQDESVLKIVLFPKTVLSVFYLITVLLIFV